MTQRVLIIDDDEKLAAMLTEYLGARGLECLCAATATEGLCLLAREAPDALILDIMLPDMDGFDVCREVRRSSSVPILMLTGRGDDMDRIVGLEIGADDYLPKPFNPRELLARLRAILRRAGALAGRTPGQDRPPGEDVLGFGELEIDRGRREVRLSGEVRPLTSHQFELLRVLAERPGRVQSREQLMEAVRGETLDLYDRSIDVHISRIRAAIEENPSRPKRIKTIRAVGYVFTAERDR